MKKYRNPAVTAILAKWPSLAEVALDVGITRIAVDRWRRRGSIPGRYDIALVAAAHRRGFDLTFEQLAQARDAGRIKRGAEA